MSVTDKLFLHILLLLLHCSFLVPREYSLSQVRDELALSSARAVDLFLHILLLLLPLSWLVPREYSLSQVWDELALSSARAVDLLLLILLWTGWSIGKMGQRQTYWLTHSLTQSQSKVQTQPSCRMGWVKKCQIILSVQNHIYWCIYILYCTVLYNILYRYHIETVSAVHRILLIS